MKRIYTLMALIALTMTSYASILDMGTPTRLFTIGARFGINTSNRTVDGNVFDKWSNNAWGTGIDAGIVADMNIRNFISLQPGFFFQSRSGSYAYVSTTAIPGQADDVLSQFGKMRSYNFTIPVMVALHFDLAPAIRWNVEVGPYVQLILKNSLGNGFMYPDEASIASTTYNTAHASKFDFGFKFGTSLTLFSHFNAGIHYMAGALDAWKDGLGGRNKAWVFSIGYNF